MRLTAILSIAVLFAACTSRDRGSESTERSPANLYAVEIVCDRTVGDGVDLLAAPHLLVRQDEPASVSLRDAEGTYTFRVHVGEQQGRLVASTVASIDHVEAGASSSTLVQFVGETADVRADGVRASVAVRPSRPSRPS